MKTVATTTKVQSVSGLFGVAKPPEKQKQIAFGNALVSQMCPSRSELSKRGSPTRKAGPRPADQVRVQVRASVFDLRSGSKLVYDLARTLAIRRGDLIISQHV